MAMVLPSPVDPNVLRDDLWDNPNLTDAQREALNGLSDDAITGALEEAFRSHEEMFYTVLDGVRSTAQARLLRDLGLAG